jgi:hypothetical protein
MNDNPLPEPLEDFLQHPPGMLPSAELQQSVLARTSAMMRPQPSRRWPVVAAVAAAVLLAIASGYFGLRLAHVDPAPKKEIVEHKLAPPPEKPQPLLEEPPPVVFKQISPLDLEWIAFDAAEEAQRVRLFFQAGDLYLDRHQDYESAVRCYQQALDNCEAQELEINPNDNWLVMAVKRDYRKEK